MKAVILAITTVLCSGCITYDRGSFAAVSTGFIWLSQRDGWRHAYIASSRGGELKQLTRGQFDVIDVLRLVRVPLRASFAALISLTRIIRKSTLLPTMGHHLSKLFQGPDQADEIVVVAWK